MKENMIANNERRGDERRELNNNEKKETKLDM